MKIPGSVELYSKGLKMKNDPSATEAERAEYREQLRQSNVRYRFRSKDARKIEVIVSETITGD